MFLHCSIHNKANVVFLCSMTSQVIFLTSKQLDKTSTVLPALLKDTEKWTYLCKLSQIYSSCCLQDFRSS